MVFIKKILTVLFLIFFSLQSFSQQSKEIGLVTENDLYVSYIIDEYYTNGLFLYYRNASETSKDTFYKKIEEYQIGQKIYNPFNSNVPFVFYQDRPYAGYSFLNYNRNYISEKSSFTIGAEIGITGEASLAEEAQNFVHRFYDKIESTGWRTQIKQRIGGGILLAYNQLLDLSTSEQRDITWSNELKLNTINSYLATNVNFRWNIGEHKLAPFRKSMLLNQHLLTKEETWQYEAFILVKPKLTYQIHDYTITGDLNRNPVDKKFELTPLVFSLDLGIYYNFKKLNLSYRYILHSKNTQLIDKAIIRYGSINIGYKF